MEKLGSGAVATKEPVAAGEVALLSLTAIAEESVPGEAVQAVEPAAPSDDVAAVVWRDFKPGGGEAGVVEEGELGLPGAECRCWAPQGR